MREREGKEIMKRRERQGGKQGVFRQITCTKWGEKTHEIYLISYRR